ncbi:MAG: bifunctional oligoribonuclease/PAP phosphatase NrnA [Lachnospiraceae bacterium]|nr:bifunctional oligoribonuclease/PAP phosphatase NrnA [Lachnospiraceae bacterium]
MFETVLEEIRRADTIILYRHKNPDGDALGSQIGLHALLRENFPKKTVYQVGDEAGRYAFMKQSAMDDVPDEVFAGALAIILDCGASHLVSDERWRLAARSVRIDHHLFCGKFCDEEVIDSGFESCCGMIALLAQEQGLRLTPLAAESLYTGMVTDSGRFRFDSVGARTLRLAAWLREVPFDTNAMYRNLYSEDLSALKRRSAFIDRIQLSDHAVAWVYTSAAEIAAMGVTPFDVSRGMVNTMADLKGVRIWVNFAEAPGEGVYCELRSSGVNINPIAVKYGGGGHAAASGATVPDQETAMAMLADLDTLAKETAEND